MRRFWNIYRGLATLTLIGGLSVISASTLLAQGFIIPRPLTEIPPIAAPQLVSETIHLRVTNQVGQFRVEQTFRNTSRYPVEGIYYFPLPEGAQVTDFALYINGKRVKGKLLSREEARRIYEDIVRRYRDPALLEYINGSLFRASIFPIPPQGERKIEIAFTQVFPQHQDLYEISYPLLQRNPAGKTREPGEGNLVVTVDIRADTPIRTVYSSTHRVEIVHKSDRQVLVSYEGKLRDAGKVFSLFYGLTEDPLGMYLLTYREKGKPGFFLFLLSPKYELKPEEIEPKDLVFVLDVSGSMAGEKIKQAQKALEYCLENLGEEDRFNILAFSSQVRSFRDHLVTPADSRKEALEFVRNLEARGGTNIHEALLQALSMRESSPRTFTVLFLTDGRPTVGVTVDTEILKAIRDKNTQRTRIFCFGVGYDVNTFLLDKISEETNAAVTYIKPDEDLEVKLSAFFEKIRYPVLTNLEVTFHNIEVEDVYPQKIPDLFKGSQLILFGRYRKAGEARVEVQGDLRAARKVYISSFDFPEENTKNDFIPPLWASRKIGYLLDEIRYHGESKELKDEIIRLSEEYGIVTPYTSYLAREPRILAAQPPGGAPGARPLVPPGDIQMMLKSYEGFAARPSAAPRAGRSAVQISKGIQALKAIQAAGESVSSTVRFIRGRTFVLKDSVWVEKGYSESARTLEIRFGSEAYFELLRLRPEIQVFLSLGDQVIFRAGRRGTGPIYIKIGPTGREKLTDSDRSLL